MRPHPDRDKFYRLWLAEYQSQNYERGLAAGVLRNSHAIIERQFGGHDRFDRVLEVGAGAGIHLDFVRHAFSSYLLTDDEPAMVEQARARHRGRAGIEYRVMNARRIDLASGSVDRLIATHVLEHINDPHVVLEEWSRVLRKGGVMSLILPCDPGWAWRLGRRFGPRAKWEKLGVPYDYWMAREHVNSIFNLRMLIRYYFDDISEFWYPLRIPTPDLNLIYGCNIRNS